MENIQAVTTGKTKCTKVAEVEVIYKSNVKPSERPVIKSSKDAYDILRNYYNKNILELQEQFCVLYLNNAKKVLAVNKHSIGGIIGTVADTRLILVTALKLAASGLILSHSHPSGALSPSRQDEAMTQRIKSAAQFMDIALLDHIIISSEDYYSMADNGII
ncbi:JAB domain-containing protein [Parafilimonas sp.]|uniref:JAB domain-containing protein n=1 Tax=Parafilimonas sp. TaxID=1969739 RepID=UPI0039E66FD2